MKFFIRKGGNCCMEYGFLSLLPPILTIVLALWTKQTILSLIIGAWFGSTIINGWNPLTGFLHMFTDYVIPSIGNTYNAGLILLVTLAGGMMVSLRQTGGAQAFAKSVSKKIDTPKKGQILTTLSAFLFCYTEPCLILGTIMRPLMDIVKVSRAKLAYILDSMGCNLASFSPISSYGPFITGLIVTQLTALGLSDNEWGIWAGMLKYNFYGLFAMITVLVVAIFDINIGKMRIEEERARTTGKVIADDVEPLVPEKNVDFPEGYEPQIKSFVLPMIALFVGLFASIFYTGQIWENGLRGAFINGNITVSICIAFICCGITAGIIGVYTKLFKPVKAFSTFIDGMAEMINVPFILVCAWTVGSVTSTMGLGEYLADIVQKYLTPGLVPALIFLFGACISFATGSSWGVWSIMMPIALPMAVQFDLPIVYVVGSVIGGGLFGDQCSPISDTTIMSSTGATCNHVVHVQTQLPYGLTVGVGAFIGYLFGGLTGQYIVSIFLTAVVIAVILFTLKYIDSKKNVKVSTAK